MSISNLFEPNNFDLYSNSLNTNDISITDLQQDNSLTNVMVWDTSSNEVKYSTSIPTGSTTLPTTTNSLAKFSNTSGQLQSSSLLESNVVTLTGTQTVTNKTANTGNNTFTVSSAGNANINNILDQDVRTHAMPSFAQISVNDPLGTDGSLVLRDGGTATFSTSLTPTQTANRSINLPDASGTLAITTQAINSSGYLLLPSGISTVLTNPMPTFINITSGGAGFNLDLPVMNASTSLQAGPLGIFFIYKNHGGSQVTNVRNNSGGAIATLTPGKIYLFQVTSNATADGAFVFADMTSVVSVSSPLALNTSTGALSIDLSNYVDLSNAQSIGGIKTFTSTLNVGANATDRTNVTTSSVTVTNSSGVAQLRLAGGEATPGASISAASGALNFNTSNASSPTLRMAIPNTGIANDNSITNMLGLNGTNLVYKNNVVDTTSSQSLTSKSVSFPTSGGTPSVLNFYETFSTACTLTGIWASGQASTLRCTRIGNNVTLSFDATIATANSAGSITCSFNLPSRFRPAAGNGFLPYNVIDNGATKLGTIFIVAANGAMTISLSTGNFSGTGDCGVLSNGASYSL